MCHPNQGYAYVEVLIAAIVLSTALVPATDALRHVVQHSAAQRDLLIHEFAATATLESVLAESFAALDLEAQSTGGTSPSAFSDPVGTPNRKLVWLAPFDLDNADADNNTLTGAEPGIVRVAVTIPELGISYETLIGSS